MCRLAPLSPEEVEEEKDWGDPFEESQEVYEVEVEPPEEPELPGEWEYVDKKDSWTEVIVQLRVPWEDAEIHLNPNPLPKPSYEEGKEVREWKRWQQEAQNWLQPCQDTGGTRKVLNSIPNQGTTIHHSELGLLLPPSVVGI